MNDITEEYLFFVTSIFLYLTKNYDIKLQGAMESQKNIYFTG